MQPTFANERNNGYSQATEPTFVDEARYLQNDFDAPLTPQPFHDVTFMKHGNDTSDKTPEKQRRDRFEFQVGEKVKYWSDTHKLWMAAVVQKINRDENNQVINYDLDVKKAALLSKLCRDEQHIPSLAELAAESEVRRLVESAEVEVRRMHRQPKRSMAEFKVEQTVEYWSDTYSIWMPALVLKIRDEESLTYDLDVKRGAHPSKIRKQNPKSAALVFPPKDACGEAPPASMEEQARSADLNHKTTSPEDVRTPLRFGDAGYKCAPPGDVATPLRFGRINNISATSGSHSQQSTTVKQESTNEQKSTVTCSSAGIKQSAGLTSEAVHAPTPASVVSSTSSHAKLPQVAPPMTNLRRVSSETAVSQFPVRRQTISYKSTVPLQCATVAQRKAPIDYQQSSLQTAVTAQTATPFQMVGSTSEGTRRTPLTVEDLQIGTGKFDPRQPNVLSQLVAKLGITGTPAVEQLKGFTGGQNEGIWIITDMQGTKSEQYVLKLISCHRCHPTWPTETENFLKLSKDHPGLSNDKEVTFPLKLFACQNPGPRRYDLIVMRPAPGTRLAEVLHTKWHAKQIPDLMKILRCVGASLKRFHIQYGNTRHADFQSANVFWDDATQAVTIIDLGGMGLTTIESDNDHFKKALRMTTQSWGAIREDGCRAFDAGYNESR